MEPPMGSRLAIGLHDDDATDADGNGLKTQRKLAGDRRYVDKPPPSSAPPPSNYLMKSPVCSQREQQQPSPTPTTVALLIAAVHN